MARLVHPFPSLLVTAVTVALIPMADTGADLSLYVVLGLGMLCFQFSIGAANDATDAALDREAKPWKPLARGAVTHRQATVTAAMLAGAGLLVTAGLDFAPWLVGGAGLACGLAYDLGLKRSRLSWLPWSLALPLVPAWVWLAVGAWSPLLWWVFPIGAMLGTAVYFANQAPDVPADRRQAVRGLAQRAGAGPSGRLAIASLGAGASAAAVVLIGAGQPGRAMACAAAGTVVLVLAPRAVRLFGRDGLFGVVAASAAVLALVFLSAA